MGNKSTKSNLRKAIIHLNISAEPVSINDEKFWNKIWFEDPISASDIIRSISIQEIRILRDGSPKNFAILTYKMVERLHSSTGTLCNTSAQQTAVMNATRILIRLIPCIFEDEVWRDFLDVNMIQDDGQVEPDIIFPKKRNEQRNYTAYLPPSIRCNGIGPRQNHMSNSYDKTESMDNVDLLHNFDDDHDLLVDTITTKKIQPNESSRKASNEKTLTKVTILSICDLLFCPEFTVTSHADNYLSNTIDAPPEDLKSLMTCDYVWEPGVGFDSKINSTTQYDKSRVELLRLLLTCLSETLYQTPNNSIRERNHWIEIFASNDNRHALPLFTSLLNVIFSYRPHKSLPFNYLLFDDHRERLAELSVQILIATLDYSFDSEETQQKQHKNLFVEYMSRIHRAEDISFIIDGFTRLLNNRFIQNYLIGSSRSINFDQELLILFWKICNLNRKFINALLITNNLLDIVVAILYHLNENFQDTSKTALIHIGVFNLLILSSERNFGVKLNKPYQGNILDNLPSFNGSHADLTIIVFHKLILYGQNLNQLYDFLVTIIVNISPYLKTLTSLASKCLIQLFEVFSSSFVIFTEPNYHQLVIFLIEVFNNLIQYQFDGNSALVYVIIKKKTSILSLANLPATQTGINKVLEKLIKKRDKLQSMEQNSTVGNKIVDENGSKQTNTPNNQAQFDYDEPLGAILSGDHSETKYNPLEVSLVATPGIQNVIESIHPNKEIDDLVDLIQLPDETIQQQRTNECLIASTSRRSSCSNSNLTLDTTKKTRFFEHEPQEPIQKKWRPTPDWVKQFKQSLPLQPLLKMIEVLVPQIEQFDRNNQDKASEAATMKFLQSCTLVGLLPVPHPIIIRKYRTNDATTLWFRACTWGIIYIRNSMWIDTEVKLIRVV